MRQLTLFLFFVVCLISVSAVAQSGGNPDQVSLKNAPRGETPKVYEYFVLREDRQIGFYRFEVEPQPTAPFNQPAPEAETENPEREVLKIRTQMGIAVKLLFVTAYKAEYSATSTYDGSTLLVHEGDATYNGSHYFVAYNRGQNPDHLIVNSAGKHIPHDPMTLHPYYVAGENRMTMITEKGKLHDITYRTVGDARIKIGVHHYDTTHVRIEGEVSRDLWYDKNGILIKVAYEKDGATINMIRKNLSHLERVRLNK